MPLNIHTVAEFQTGFELGLTQHYKDNLKLHSYDYREWLRERQAQRLFDTDWVTSGVGVMPEKNMGADIQTDKIISGPTKQHDLKFFAIALVLIYEASRWAMYGLFKGLAADLAKSAVDRHNLVAYGALNESFTTTQTRYQTYTGNQLVDTDHPTLDGGTWSNQLADNDGLSYVGLQKICILIQKTVNERQRFVQGLYPRHLIVSLDQEWIADTLLKSTLRPGTANNDTNTLRAKNLTTHASVYLTTPEHWWVKVPKKNPAFKVFMRIGDRPDFQRDSDARSRNRIMTSYCSFNMAAFDSRGLAGSTGGA